MRDPRKPAVCIIVENLSVICPKGRALNSSRETVNGIEIYGHPALNATGIAQVRG
jgi:hypothetical protein